MNKDVGNRTKAEMSFFARKVAELINFVVERWYPDCVFYGSRYAETFSDADQEAGDPLHTAAATSLIVAAHRRAEERGMNLEVAALILNNKDLGAWEISVRPKADTASSEKSKDEIEKEASLTMIKVASERGVKKTIVRVNGFKRDDTPEENWVLTVERAPKVKEDILHENVA
jgi:hypothetical protein